MSTPHNKIAYSRSIDDYSTWSGAHKLCGRIRAYWEERGYQGLAIEPVKIDLENSGRHLVFTLRSNMVGGFPPKDLAHKGMGQ